MVVFDESFCQNSTSTHDCEWSRSEDLEHFSDSYMPLHGYFFASVCTFGVIMNTLMCAVLRHKTLLTPVNLLLLFVAIADMLKMLTYGVYVLYMNVACAPHYNPCVHPHKYGWILFILVHNALLITSHTVSTLLTVSLTCFRYVAVYFPRSGPQWCNMRRARLTVLWVTVASIILQMPNNFMYEITIVKPSHHWFRHVEWARHSILIQNANMMIYGIGVKIASSLCITVFSALLIYEMNKVKERRRRLKVGRATVANCHDNTADERVAAPAPPSHTHQHTQQDRDHNRTTAMLLAVAISFVVTEFPQGVLNLAAGIDECIFVNIYDRVGDLMDALVVLNSSTNFLLLCAMSKQFRSVFRLLFVTRFCKSHGVAEVGNGAEGTHLVAVTAARNKNA